MSQWVRVGKVSDFPEGAGQEVVAGSKLVAVYHKSGNFCALDGICPHAGGPLAKGKLTGDIVTCPWHGWQFHIHTGQHGFNANLKHPCFAVKVEGEDVLVEVPE